MQRKSYMKKWDT